MSSSFHSDTHPLTTRFSQNDTGSSETGVWKRMGTGFDSNDPEVPRSLKKATEEQPELGREKQLDVEADMIREDQEQQTLD